MTWKRDKKESMLPGGAVSSGFSLVSDTPQVSTDLYTPFASEFTGNWAYLRGDGTQPAGSLALAPRTARTANTVVASGHSAPLAASYISTVGEAYESAAIASPTNFSLIFWGTIDRFPSDMRIGGLIAPGASLGERATISANVANKITVDVSKTGGSSTFLQELPGTWLPRTPMFVVATYEYVADGTSRLVVYSNGVQILQSATAVGPFSTSDKVLAFGKIDGDASYGTTTGNMLLAGYTEKALSPYTVRRMARQLGYDQPKSSVGWRSTITRTTPASIIHPNGRIGWAPSGFMRYSDYGTFFEPASTNLLTNSQGETGWTPVGTPSTTASYNNAFGPDGSKTATLITYNSTSGTSRWVAPSVTLTAGNPYAVSVIVKPGTLRWLALRYEASNSWFDLTNKVAGTQGIGWSNPTVETLADGYLRVSALRTATTGGAQSFVLVAGSADNTEDSVGDGKTLYLAHAQVESQVEPTSPILTTSATATRNRDDLAFGTNILQELYNSEGATGRWTATNATLTVTSEVTAPDGTLTAFKVVPSGASSAAHLIYQAPPVALTTGYAYRYSVYLKALDGRYVTIARDDSPYYGAVTVDLQTGTAVAADDATAAGTYQAKALDVRVVNAGNGWWRVSTIQVAQGSSAANDRFNIAAWNSATPPVQGGSLSFTQAGESFYAWGANITRASTNPWHDTYDDYMRTPAVTAQNGSPDLAYGQVRKRIFPRNWVKQSEALGTTPWAITASGATLVATNNTTEVTDPFGGNKATKLAFSDVTGSDTAFITQGSMGENVNSIYTGSIWLRTDTGTATLYAICTSTNAQWTSLAVTDQWQRFSWLMARGTPLSFIIGIKAGVSGMGTLPAPVNVYAYGAMMTDGAEPVTSTSVYVPTGAEPSDTFALKGRLRMDVGYTKNVIEQPLPNGTFGYSAFAWRRWDGSNQTEFFGTYPPNPDTATFTAWGARLNAWAYNPVVNGTASGRTNMLSTSFQWSWRAGTATGAVGGIAGSAVSTYTLSGEMTANTWYVGNRPDGATPWFGYVRNIRMEDR